MSEVVSAVTPFDDPSRPRRLVKVLAWLGGTAVLVVVLHLLGVDVRGWISSFWDSLTDVSVQYVVAGLALQTVQTALTALAWLFILRAGYPDAVIPYRSILAAYAAGVAMNGFLPANIGTFASLLMYMALIAGATFPGVLGAMVVQKIFFTIAGTAVYLYLFLSVPGSFSLQLGWFEAHRGLTVVLIAGGVLLLVILARAFRTRLQTLWDKAKQGGAILANGRAYLVRVVLPSFGAWTAKLLVIAVFLAAYSIPVTFHTVMSVAGGNSLANTVSATPGGVGINQAINTASLSDVTDPQTAAAYSTGQQLIVTAWNVALAVGLVVWAFGWTGGKLLVANSYADAKTKVAEQKAERAAKKDATRAERAKRRHERPRIRPVQVLVAWVLSAAAILFAAWVVPGVDISGFGAALAASLVIAVLNALIPPLLAAIRLPFTLVLGFLLVLVVDAAMFVLAAELLPDELSVDSWWSAFLAALVAAAASVVLDVIFRADDDETYAIRVTQRIARRSGEQVHTDVPGIVFLEIDGLGLPVLQRAMRDGSAPELARWLADGDYALSEWETDLSSQTGASQAGILLGSNDDVPAFRWVEKETGRMMTCSKPPDCAELERRRASGVGLLRNGGASRGNLLSGEADHVILTVSRISDEKRANPGYRAFFANGFNVTRVLVLFVWEVILEVTAALRAHRRDVRPRGHRGGIYPLMRAAMCVIVRDLIVYGVLTDMMKGRPAIYATFSSYDEVAHHSGLERADTLEALRKLDQQFKRIERARRYAPRPYELVVLSDHGQTQGATFKQRNGYSLAELVTSALSSEKVAVAAEGEESSAMLGNAMQEATGGGRDETAGEPVGEEPVVLASGNLGLVYLPDEPRRLTLEEIEARHPALVPALREHPDIGFVMARSAALGPVVLGAHGSRRLETGDVEGEDPLAPFSPNAAQHLRRTDGFAHAPDLLVNSFYDPQLDEGCAFEELISFHGGLGGAQTRPFILHPTTLPLPDQPIVGAAAVHAVLSGWRELLQGGSAAPAPQVEHAAHE